MSACAREVPRFTSAISAVLVLLLLPAAAQTPPEPRVWVAGHKNLLSIDPAANQATAAIALTNEVENVAVDPRSGAVWVLSHKRLEKLDSAGSRLFDLDLKSLDTSFEEGERLALNPYDGSLWIAGKKRLLSVTETGTKRLGWSAPDRIEGIALDIDETLWLLTKRRLLHLSRDANPLAEVDLTGHSHNPRSLAVDGLGGFLWVVDEKQLLRFDSNYPDPAPLSIALPEDQHETRASGSHPVFGTIWLAGKDQLLIYDRNGTLIRRIDLKPYALGQVEALVFEPGTLSLWLVGSHSLGRFTSGGEFIAAIPLPTKTEAAAAGPFVLRPTVNLVAPPDNALTNDPAPRLEYELGPSAAERRACWPIVTCVPSTSMLPLTERRSGPLI